MPQKRWLVWNEKHCEILNRLIGSRFGLIAYAMMSPYDQSWQYLTTNINPWIIDHQTRIWWNAMRNTNLYTAIISHSFSWDVSISHLWFCCLCYYNMVQGSSAGKTINPSLPGKTVFGVLMWYDHYNTPSFLQCTGLVITYDCDYSLHKKCISRISGIVSTILQKVLKYVWY